MAVQCSFEDGKHARQGEHGVGTEGRGQDGIGGLQADCHCLQVSIPGQRDFHGRVWLHAHCSHSSPLLAFSLTEVLPSLGCSILVHGQDACEANCFGLPGTRIVQGISRWVLSAPIHCKCSTPSPLPGQLT